jgi:hypothetical protein
MQQMQQNEIRTKRKRRHRLDLCFGGARVVAKKEDWAWTLL